MFVELVTVSLLVALVQSKYSLSQKGNLDSPCDDRNMGESPLGQQLGGIVGYELAVHNGLPSLVQGFVAVYSQHRFNTI